MFFTCKAPAMSGYVLWRINTAIGSSKIYAEYIYKLLGSGYVFVRLRCMEQAYLEFNYLINHPY